MGPRRWWQRRTWVAWATVGAVGAAATFGAVRLADARDRGAPDEWDPAVLDLVTFVEARRGLTFDHPVAVDYVDASVIGDEMAAAAGTSFLVPKWADLEAGRYRADGLADGEIDVLAATQVRAQGVVEAFYRNTDDTIVVPVDEPPAPGTPLPVNVRVTLVHELVHALQDQHFTVIDGQSPGDVEATIGLIEGDATLVESMYIDGLTDTDFEAYLAYYDQPDESYERALDEVPPIMLAEFADAYILGETLVRVLFDVGGYELVNDALVGPPDTPAALFDPYGYLDDLDAGNADAAWSDLGEFSDTEGEVYTSGVGGPAHWFLAFGEFMSPDEAFTAARGWRSDAFIAVDVDDVLCTEWKIEDDAGPEGAALRDALRRWADRIPTVRSATFDGSVATVTACDPGPEHDLDVPDDYTAYLAYARYVVAGEWWADRNGLDRGVGACVAIHDLGDRGFEERLMTARGFEDRAVSAADPTDCS